MSEHTPGPWVQFTNRGKCIAIMPAGRAGDICTFEQSPRDADALIMALAPNLVKALERIAALDPQRIRADDLGRAAHIAHEALSLVGIPDR
jgi:hypothetical protein